MERDKALDVALGQIEKQFGKGAVMRMGDNLSLGIEAISTGAMSLDLALGVGGLPRGRVVELFGPESSGKSTLALHVVAEAQRNGGTCAYIDAEHALDPVYAKAIGVDVDELLISQPDTGEQALEIADMLIRSGAIDVIVIDSVAALTPRAEIEGEMGDSHVGLQARLMSQALRKLTGTLNKSNTIALFINQLREKIGVMYGCFSYSTRVTLADGTQEKIGKIVNQRLPVEVLSYDFATGEIRPRQVVSWFDNGRTDEFVRVTVRRPGGDGRSQFSATAAHKVMTPTGWREAGDLKAGDFVLQSALELLSEQQMEVLRGGLMGDIALSRQRNGISVRARWSHGVKQIAYAMWKESAFSNIGTSSCPHAQGGIEVNVAPLTELSDLYDEVYAGDGRKHFSDEYLKRVGELGLATWFQDDFTRAIRSMGKQTRTAGTTGRATVCVEAMSQSSRHRVLNWLKDTWGLECKLIASGARRKAVIVFSAAATGRLSALVAPYTHPSMAYKLLPQHRHLASEVVVQQRAGTRVLIPARVETVLVGPPNGKQTHRFDIEVEGSHNYFVDRVMVHNSPETTPGGRALKFYSSVRLDIRRVESIKDGGEIIGNRTRVKVVKNKCASPFRTAEFDIMYGQGISREGSILDVAVDLGIVKKSGAWYTYEGEQLGQGRENAKLFLRENTELVIEIDERIRKEVSAVTADVQLGAGVGDDEPITLD
jgi:recombination protein RecA